MKKILIECCVETYGEAINAEKKGANQIELCSDLNNDGLTPNFDLIKKVIQNISIPVKIMVRPRIGDFNYTDTDMKEIKKQIFHLKSIDINHIVFGALTKNKIVHINNVKRVGDWAYPMKITFHKAIDHSIDFFKDIEILVESRRIDGILTSGKSDSASSGAKIINKVVSSYGKKIKIISAGKITASNLNNIHKKIGGSYYHGRKILGKLY